MADHRTIGEILRYAREQAGLTQAALAARVGLAPNHLVRLESGEKAQPRFDTVARLAAELGLSLDDLAARCGYRTAQLPPKSSKAVARTAAALREFLSACSDVENVAKDALHVMAGEPVGASREPSKRAGKRRRA